MKKLIIPKIDELERSLSLAEKYDMGFEYDDFFDPETLDDEKRLDGIVKKYLSCRLPDRCTLHGAFYDVIVFSPDRRAREFSDLRVRQSVAAAEKIGAKAVIFHTNYNPFLNSEEYIKNWVKTNAEYWRGILAEFPHMNIYLENMFDTAPYVMERLAENLCGCPNFGICLDYAHCALTSVPHKEWAEALGKYVKHMHINDNDLKSDLHLAVGDGKIDWREFLELYDKYMNKASVLIEVSAIDKQERSVEYLKKLTSRA